MKPVFFLRVMNTDDEPKLREWRRIMPITGNTLIGRKLVSPEELARNMRNAALARAIIFRHPFPGSYCSRSVRNEELDELIAELIKTKPGYQSLFSDQAVMAAMRSCGRGLWFGSDFGSISRIHAMLRLADIETEPKLLLHNLSSLNLLAVNGRPFVRRDQPMLHGIGLNDGDIISFSENPKPTIKVYKAPAYVKALVVATDFKDEKQERFVGGIDKLERAITKVGGHSDTIKILGREATPKRLMAILKDLRCEDSDSLLIVTIYVHGSTDRLRLWGGEITKKQLTAALDKIPCKKVIIANTCHAEGYWNDNEIEDALVLLSSKSDELTYSSRFLDDVARFIERNLEEGKPVDFKELELAYEKQTPPTPKGRTALF